MLSGNSCSVREFLCNLIGYCLRRGWEIFQRHLTWVQESLTKLSEDSLVNAIKSACAKLRINIEGLIWGEVGTLSKRLSPGYNQVAYFSIFWKWLTPKSNSVSFPVMQSRLTQSFCLYNSWMTVDILDNFCRNTVWYIHIFLYSQRIPPLSFALSN